MNLPEWLTVLAVTFRQEITENLAIAYREALSDLTASELEKGCARVLRENRFFPTPAEIRQAAGADRSRSLAVAAEVEWAAAYAHVDCYGPTVYPSDPVLHLSPAGDYAFRMVGRRSGILAAFEREQIHFCRRDFVAAYQLYQESNGLRLSAEEAKRLWGSAQKALPENVKVEI